MRRRPAAVRSTVGALAALPLVLPIAAAYLASCSLTGISDGVRTDSGVGPGADANVVGDAAGSNIFARGLTEPTEIAIGASTAYFVAKDTVQRCPLADCTSPEVVAEAQGEPRSLVVSGTRLAWVNRTGNQVMVVDEGASTPRVFVDGQDAPFAVGYSNETVVWSNSTCLNDGWCIAICRPGDCGEETIPLCRNALQPSFLAVGERHVVWAEERGIMTTPLAGDGNNGYRPTLLSRRSRSVQGLAIDEASAYWTEAEGGVYSVRRIADSEPTTLATEQGNPWAIALDGGYVYFTVNSKVGSGSVRRVSAIGGAVEILRDGLNGPRGLAITADSVFVAVTDDGTILRLPKPR